MMNQNAAKDPPRAVLILASGPDKGKRIDLNERKTMVFGRSRSAHWQMPANDPRCSRLHFILEFRPEDGVLRALDLGSRNGLRINKQRVWHGDLRDGDLLQAGPVVFRVKLLGAPLRREPNDLSPAYEDLQEKRDRRLGRSPQAPKAPDEGMASAAESAIDDGSDEDISPDDFDFSPTEAPKPASPSRPAPAPSIKPQAPQKTVSKVAPPAKTPPARSAPPTVSAKAFDPMEVLGGGPLIDEGAGSGEVVGAGSSASPNARHADETNGQQRRLSSDRGPGDILPKGADDEIDFNLDEFRQETPEAELSWDASKSLGAEEPAAPEEREDDFGPSLDLDLQLDFGSSGEESLASQVAPAVSAPDELPRIPGYRTIDFLGKGVLGETFRAIRETDGKTYAVKVIRPGKDSEHAAAIDSFLAGAASLLEISHAHIVPYRDIGKGPGFVYVASDYLDGIDGERWIREKGAMSVGQAAKLFYGLLLALDYAKENNLCHRDIKPSNILITRQGTREICMFLDFGLQLAYNNSTLATVKQKFELEHSIRFTAPEHVNNFRDPNPSADIFSLAATMYYMLTACYIHEFSQLSFDQSVTKLKRDDAVLIHQRAPDIPQPLGDLIHSALQRFPSRRLSDVTMFRKEVAKFIR